MSNVPPPPPGFVLMDTPTSGGAIPPPPPGFVLLSDNEPQKRGGLALNTTAGINDALYTVAGAPVDLARGAINLGISGLNKVAGTEVGHIPSDSFMGSDWIADRMGEVHPVLDPQNTEARTMSERIARSTGEGVGYTVAPQVMLGGMARAGAGKAVEAASRFAGTPASVGEAAGTIVSGALAGTGASTATEFTPDKYDPLAAVAGGLTGGLIGAGLAAVPRIGRAAWDAAGDFVAPMTEEGRKRLAGRQLYEAATDPNAVREAIADGADEIIPGSQPTTFQQTGDLGIGGLERGAAARRPDLFAQRRADQNAARLTQLGSLQEQGAPEAVARAVREHLARIDDETQQALNAATQAAQSGARRIGAGASPEAAGSAMRQALEAARATAKEQERALWQAVDPDGTLALGAQGTRQAARSIADDLAFSAKPIEGEEAAIHGVLQQYGDVVPFKELTALQSRLKLEMRSERFANGDSPAYTRLSQLNRAIETDLETAIAGKVAQEADAVARGAIAPEHTAEFRIQQWQDDWFQRQAQARTADADSVAAYGGTGSVAVSRSRGTTSQGGRRPGNPQGDPRLQGDALQPNFDEAALGRLRQARDATLDRVNTFDNKTLGPIRRRPSSNSPYEMPAAAVPERIFNASPSSPEAIRRFRDAVGDEQALPVLQEYAVDRVRAFAMDGDGSINPARLASWRRRHQDALKSFPELDARLSDAGRVSEAVEQVARTRKLRLDDARKGKLGAIMNVDDPADIVNTVGSVYGRNDSLQQMARVRQAVGSDQEALEGLKKSTVDYMMKRFVGNTEVAASGQAGISSDQFQTFLRNNKDALRMAGFTADDLTRMQAIAADLQRSNRSIAGVRIPGGSNTTQDMLAAGEKGMSNLGRLLSVIGAGAGALYNPLAAMAGVMGGQAISAMRRAGLNTVDDLVADALLNPSVARILLSNATSKPDHGIWKALGQYYAQAARTTATKGLAETTERGDAGRSGGQRRALELTVTPRR
jgi:hypothetical protein